jgi:hypothetical protein
MPVPKLKKAEIGQATDDVRMARAQRFPVECQRALVERRGLAEAVLDLIKARPVIKARADVGVALGQGLLADC